MARRVGAVAGGLPTPNGLLGERGGGAPRGAESSPASPREVVLQSGGEAVLPWMTPEYPEAIGGEEVDMPHLLEFTGDANVSKARKGQSLSISGTLPTCLNCSCSRR